MTGIVHIGPGAFHRAHQAVYTQDAGDDWGITGISLRSTEFADVLTAQNGRYTLVTRGAEGSSYRVMTALQTALSNVRNPAMVRSALTRPETRVVSLTITEKGYAPTPDDRSAIALLVNALKDRKEAGLAAFTILSCDNLSDNGSVLKEAVLAMAPPELGDWIERHASFPATMVDRITPAATPTLLTEVAAETGWADQIPVETESFSQWVIEDRFVSGRPAWERSGALLVSDVTPFEKMKLRMLNGAHSMLAYAGHLAGKTYVRDVMADPVLADRVSRHMTAAAQTLTPTPDLDTQQYRHDLLARFRNPQIAHETYQIAMDGSQKMPQRIFAPAQEAAEAGLDVQPFAMAAALWLRYLEGRSDAGTPYALRDPREVELAALPTAFEDRVDALFALPNLVPDRLAANPVFRTTLISFLRALTEHGVLAALQGNSRT